MVSFYSEKELDEIGFKQIGNGVKISKHCSIYGSDKITIGNNVRIDDFCILSGVINIENNIHIGAYCALFGGSKGITMKDFSGLSSRCVIYAESDDYSGEFLTNPTIPMNYRNVIGGEVIIDKHVIIGSGCTVLPNITIGMGTAVGSMSLVNKNLEPLKIYAGVPCKIIKNRDSRIEELEEEFKNKL